MINHITRKNIVRRISTAAASSANEEAFLWPRWTFLFSGLSFFIVGLHGGWGKVAVEGLITGEEFSIEKKCLKIFLLPCCCLCVCVSARECVSLWFFLQNFFFIFHSSFFFRAEELLSNTARESEWELGDGLECIDEFSFFPSSSSSSSIFLAWKWVREMRASERVQNLHNFRFRLARNSLRLFRSRPAIRDSRGGWA